MVKLVKRILLGFLSLTLVMSLIVSLSPKAGAVDTVDPEKNAETISGSDPVSEIEGRQLADDLDENTGETVYHVEPLYRDLITEEELAQRLRKAAEAEKAEYSENATVPFYATLNSAAKYLKNQMIARKTEVTFLFPLNSAYDNIDILEAAQEYTESGTGKSGDALRWGKIGWSYDHSKDVNEYGNTCYKYTYTFLWTTTNAQETALTSKVDSVMSSLNLSGKTETQKVKAIHDYICDHVDYDNEHVDQGDDYPLQFSAYAAMCKGSAVCQGYAILFYRMCKEAGLSVRVITSARHAWNIVKVGDVYYNVDTTWDGGDSTTYYDYYMKGMRDFNQFDHIRENPYDTYEFEQAFPMVKDSKMNLANITQSYSDIDGTSRTSKSTGKPKVLIFGKIQSKSATGKLLKQFSDYDLSSINIYALDFYENYHDSVEEFRDATYFKGITYIADNGEVFDKVGAYLQHCGYNDSLVTELDVFFIDQNNKIQDYRVGLTSFELLLDLIKQQLGVTIGYAAPRIIEQPSTYKGNKGGIAVFAVDTRGQGPQTFQWYYRKSASGTWTKSTMDGATRDEFWVEAVAGRHGYQYRCAVSNDYGTTYSNIVSLYIKPSITVQPESVRTLYGKNVTFTIKASPVKTYQWYYRTSSSGTWKKSTAADATTNTFTVSAIKERNGYQYRCIITNEAGSVTSNAATLTVTTEPDPVITEQPQSVTANEGETVNFTVKANNAKTYQWYYRKSTSGSWSKSTGTGATTDTLTVTSQDARNGYQYYCKISNTAASLNSDTVTLTVNPLSKPSITTQPADATANLNSTVTFTVEASRARSYQWYYRTSATGNWAKSTTTGATTKTLTVKAEKKRNGYQYRCVVKNNLGSVTSSAATLTVKASLPVITKQPVSVRVVQGSSTQISIEATDAVSYEWYYGTTYEDEVNNWRRAFEFPGVDTNVLTIPEANMLYESRQFFRCKVTNTVGEVYSDAVEMVVVHHAPEIEEQPSNVTVYEGEKARFYCDGSWVYGYQWYYRTSSTGNWAKCTSDSATSNCLTVEGTLKRNGYQYKCVVWNDGGSTTSNIATLTVKKKNTANDKPNKE